MTGGFEEQAKAAVYICSPSVPRGITQSFLDCGKDQFGDFARGQIRGLCVGGARDQISHAVHGSFTNVADQLSDVRIPARLGEKNDEAQNERGGEDVPAARDDAARFNRDWRQDSHIRRAPTALRNATSMRAQRTTFALEGKGR